MRKSETYTVTDAGRDYNKTFALTEMPASQAEKWATRAFLALAKSGVDVPDDVAESGIAGLASFGIKGLSGLAFADAEPLLDEMMSCVKMVRDPRHPEMTFPITETDIEEIQTRFKLRAAIFKLHVNFSTDGSPSNLALTTSGRASEHIGTSRSQ